MRILGLDVGERRIGVAVSDALGISAQGVTVLERHDLPADLDAVAALVATYTAERLVVGLPLTLKGERGPQAQRVVSFAEALQRRIPVPVILQDERLTTVQGQRALTSMGTSTRKSKAVIDRVAAQLILQHYLDASQARRNA